jgi:hypothetical protein
MNDRNYDIRLVEKTMKIDKMFEDFLKDKLGDRGQQNAKILQPADTVYGSAESANPTTV